MLFGSQRKLGLINDVKLEINGEIIERVESFKYLGQVHLWMSISQFRSMLWHT